jgi:hypothetical protein
MLVFYEFISTTLHMSVQTYQTTRRHIPEDDTLHNHRCENLKSYKACLIVLCPAVKRQEHEAD